ncbi:MAG: hypothetical protein AB8B97_24625 [Granulosicoccus sp.]
MFWTRAKNIPQIPEPSDPGLTQATHADSPEEVSPSPAKAEKKPRPLALNGRPNHLKTVFQILVSIIIGAIIVWGEVFK